MKPQQRQSWRHGSRKPSFRYNPRIARIFQEIAIANGRRVERLADEALESRSLPSWIIRHESHAPNSAMDAQGIDLTLHTNRGPVHIQIKSSRKSADEFQVRQKNGHYWSDIVVIVIVPGEPLTRIANRIIQRATERYARMQQPTPRTQ